MAKGKERNCEMSASHSCFFWRSSLTIGIISIWTSVIVTPYGTYLQTLSPHFPEYEQHKLTKMAAAGLTSPGAGIGLTFASAWPIVAVFCAAVGLLFIFGVWVLRSIAGWNRDLALVASGAFICGCLIGSFSGIQEAISNLRWGFLILSIGYLMSAVGLIFGAIGVLRLCLNKSAHYSKSASMPIKR